MKNEKNAKHASKPATVEPVNDFNIEEESSNWWKIIAVILVLIFLVGGFAIFRNYENSKKDSDTEEKDNDKKDNDKKDDDKKDDDKKGEEENNNTTNNNGNSSYTPTVVNNDTNKNTTPTPVTLTFDLPSVSETNEAGEIFRLSVPYVVENGRTIYALLSYEYRQNSGDSFVAVAALDSNIVGEYRITYTMVYVDGREEVKTQIVRFLDTKAPVVTGVNNGALLSSSITPIIWDASGYSATLNGLPYNGETIVALDDTYTEYELVVTDTLGHTTTINFTIDKVLPIITVVYSPDGTDITTGNVFVTITSDKPLVTVPDTEWQLSLDKLILTKEFIVNGEDTLTLGDVAGNTVTVDVLVNWINVLVEEEPKLDLPEPDPLDPIVTITHIVANQVKVTVTTLNPITINDAGWTDLGSIAGRYVQEKVYYENIEAWFTYTDGIVNGQFKVFIDITFDDALVTYGIPDSVTGNIIATVTTTEEIELAKVPAGWMKVDAFTYTKEYDASTNEVVEFAGETILYRAVISVDIIVPIPAPLPAPIAPFVVAEVLDNTIGNDKIEKEENKEHEIIVPTEPLEKEEITE